MVGHSFGGMVVKWILNEYGDPFCQNLRLAITVATPFYGSTGQTQRLFTSEPTMRCNTVDGCLVIGRFLLRSNTPAEVAAALASGKLGVRLRQLWFWNLKKVAKAVAGDAYLALRRTVYD